MKKFFLTATITSSFLLSSATQCITDIEQVALGVLVASTALGIGIYAYYNQNPSTPSPESHPEQQIQHDQQPQGKKKPQLIKDLKKSRNHGMPSGITQENTSPQEGTFLTTLLDRIREEETPKHLENLLNDVAFEH